MLLNLSNHPSALWSSAQRAVYAEIQDLPFPQIDPEGDGVYIDALVREYLTKIEQLKNVEAVHVMGEMCFCYRIINELKARGIKCVASTSKRIVEELEPGKKNVTFQFVRFREY